MDIRPWPVLSACLHTDMGTLFRLIFPIVGNTEKQVKNYRGPY